MAKIKNIIEGFTKEKPVSEEWYKSRLSICGACEFNSLNGANLSVGCKTLKMMGCPSDEKGSCSQCCCCVEEKAVVKAESCPKGKWGKMEVINNEFKLDMITPSKVTVEGGVFKVDLGAVDTDNLNIEFDTTSIRKTLLYSGAKAGCSCTTSLPKELYKGRSYRHNVNISLSVFGQQNKSLELHFVGENRTTYSVSINFKFNRINPNI